MTLLEELKAFEGQDAGPAMTGPDPVNEPMIRHWCEAMGDDLPVYTDEAAAAASVHKGIIAPPTMLQAWTMLGLRRPSEGGSRYTELLSLLDRNGYSSVVATNCEQEYLRELRPGDRISVRSVIEHITEEKRTALGAGHFLTSRMEFQDQHGEVVGTQRWTILKFKPPGR
jgi:acyl dehydratase